MNQSGKALIGIIIPVHNTEEFLEECLESVIGQTYKNLEILVVDDDSNDGSKKIIEKFQKIDDRVNYHHTNKHNAALTRGYGVSVSSAEYICFVDSDDIISSDYVESLYEALVESGADISTAQIKKFKELKDINLSPEKSSRFKVENDLPLYFMGNYNATSDPRHIPQSINAKLFAKDILEKIDYSLIKTTILEDNYVMPQILKNSKKQKIAVINRDLYFYRRNPNSTMSQSLSKMIDYDGESISYPQLFERIMDYIHSTFADHSEIENFILRTKSKRYYELAQVVVEQNITIKSLKHSINEYKLKDKSLAGQFFYKMRAAVKLPIRAANRAVRSLKQKLGI